MVNDLEITFSDLLSSHFHIIEVSKPLKVLVFNLFLID